MTPQTETTGNPFDDAVKSGQLRDNPYPVYDWLREQSPICWSQQWNSWVLSRYADVAAVTQDSARFTSVGRVVNEIRRLFSDQQLERVELLMQHYSVGLINSDPPVHTCQRKLVQSTFVPRVLERLRPFIQRIVDELLDQVQAKGRIEVIRDLSFPLPITVIAELLGIPVEMRGQFKAWSTGIIQFMATPRPSLEIAERSQSALKELREYFKNVFRDRHAHPRDDLISALVAASVEGHKLTDDELLSTCVTILIGGHETTTSLIASGLWLLASRPELQGQLIADPMLAASAVEEFLRYEPPFQRIIRVTNEDVEFYGKTILRGQTVVLLIGAANRDPRAFALPEVLDIRRAPNRHLSFGYGAHFCLGAALARLEATIAINTGLRRMPSLSLDSMAVEWHDGMVRSLKELPLRFAQEHDAARRTE